MGNSREEKEWDDCLLTIYCCHGGTSLEVLHMLSNLMTQGGKQSLSLSPFYRWGDWVSVG